MLPSRPPSSEGRRVVFLVGAALAFLGPGGTSTSPSRCEPFRGFGMWVWTFPKWPKKIGWVFFWFWMAGLLYTSLPLSLSWKNGMYILYIYIYILQFRWVLSTCYKHVECSPWKLWKMMKHMTNSFVTFLTSFLYMSWKHHLYRTWNWLSKTKYCT